MLIQYIKIKALSPFSLILSLCCLNLACKEEDPRVRIPTFIEQEFPITYNATNPDGKLPLPHHNPELNQADADQLTDELFIINNYGLYQGSDTDESCYFHNALDIILPNRTPIFAVEAGIVRANIGGDQYYRTLIVEDLDDISNAWSYTHIFDIAVVPGEIIEKGQFIGVVNFKGLEHIHLGRMKIKNGGIWTNFSDHIYYYPDDYFTLIDTMKPFIKTPFHYFNNNSNTPIDNGEEIDTITGQVDLVVSMRDAGQYSGAVLTGSAEYWGDRLAIRNVYYRILKNGIEIENIESFDFRKIEIESSPVAWKQTLTAYKHRRVLDQDPGNYNMFYSHYVLTHIRDNFEGSISSADEDLAWDTEELNDSGEAKFPDGLYDIEVHAFDTNGNEAVKTDQIYIKNN